MEKRIVFSLKVDNKNVCRIFSIYIYKIPLTKEYVEKHFELWFYLKTVGGKTFMAEHATGPEPILVDGKHDSAQKAMVSMIDDDFLNILKTIKFNA